MGVRDKVLVFSQKKLLVVTCSSTLGPKQPFKCKLEIYHWRCITIILKHILTLDASANASLAAPK